MGKLIVSDEISKMPDGQMDRRTFVQGVASLAAAGTLATVTSARAQTPSPVQVGLGQAVPFDHAWLLRQAQQLSTQPYKDPASTLPDALGDLSYDQYRDIRFKPEARIWAGDNLPFELDLFHEGFMFKNRVEISLVEKGMAQTIQYSPNLFTFGPSVKQPTDTQNLAFSGFRVRSQINNPNVWDEFLVFQGASYMRAVGKNQTYGLSSRGLALKTAEPEGEEFPAFTHFWIERPAGNSPVLVIHALLDSPSTTGAYRFSVRPGDETNVDVEAAIYPRSALNSFGMAPLTSMFLFDDTYRASFDDYRTAVHDSDGLQMQTGAGEWLWRPLANPAELQISAFQDVSPRGFGLMQRSRRFQDYEDLEARYERRPSLWVEPIGDWAEGRVELVEIPTQMEIHDNIVAYWRPNNPVGAGGPFTFSYRTRWLNTVNPPPELMTVAATRAGLTIDGKRRIFQIDFAGKNAASPQGVSIDVTTSVGKILNPVLQSNPYDQTLRVSFELDNDNKPLAELRVRLMADNKAISETWLYRWTKR
ncbi:glucans biosynthesis protein [Faunimonas pinastri]|uniref:Glucans biosynthesis protein n=2 Tax=Faunimonas pinastri TaxID=1855383 RepID=A0A1H9AEJ4_9HYPH|nr:glucans biosynthesis protein [Faunimonas pinastri]